MALSRSRRSRILLLGEPRPCFAEILEDLAETGIVDHGDNADRFCRTWEKKTAREPFPDYDLVVLLVSHPGEFSPRILRGLRSFAPLLPCLAVLDSWCEGSMRTDNPMDGILRLYLHQWPSRGKEMLTTLSQTGKMSSIRRSSRVFDKNWTVLPPTAAEEDRILLEMSCEPQVKGNMEFTSAEHDFRGTVFVLEDGPVGVDPTMGEFLQMLFERKGWKHRSGSWERIDHRITAVIADLPELPPDGWERLLEDVRSFRLAFPKCRLLFLAHSPRFEERVRLRVFEDVAVFSKPFRNKDLLRFLS